MTVSIGEIINGLFCSSIYKLCPKVQRNNRYLNRPSVRGNMAWAVELDGISSRLPFHVCHSKIQVLFFFVMIKMYWHGNSAIMM